jgi:phenylacetate-coenzyme A ligase PaaK-like adenylate-forming protein
MVIRLATQIPERNTLAKQIIDEIKNASEVKPEVEFAEAKEIYNAEVVTKAIRFVDQRPKTT